jgi:hypothetical protein
MPLQTGIHFRFAYDSYACMSAAFGHGPCENADTESALMPVLQVEMLLVVQL